LSGRFLFNNDLFLLGKKLVFVGGNRGTEAGQAGSGPGQTEVPLSPRRTWSTSSFLETFFSENRRLHLYCYRTPLFLIYNIFFATFSDSQQNGVLYKT